MYMLYERVTNNTISSFLPRTSITSTFDGSVVNKKAVEDPTNLLPDQSKRRGQREVSDPRSKKRQEWRYKIGKGKR